MKLTSPFLVVFLSLSASESCDSRPLSSPPGETIAAPAQQPVAAEDEVAVLVRRYNDPKHVNMLQSAMWTLSHDYKDLKRVDEVMRSFGQFMAGFQKHVAGDAAPLESLGGVKAFKEKAASWLGDDDQAVRAFGALISGINGDRESIPLLLKIIKRKDAEEEFSQIYDKGRAAIGLGLLGAVDHKPDIVLLLKSKNDYDRSGAITALTLLGAKEHAKEVAAILSDRNSFRDDPSPVFFLVETGTAKDYKKELLAAMLSQFRGDTAKAAMYALVRIKAKEDSAAIAKLLNDQFRKGDAAKALALLGATEYTEKIGMMLNSEDELTQAAAALALGILGAKKYETRLASMMVRKEGFVNSYAAAAIVMMDSAEYTAQASKILAKFKAEGVYLTDGSFHPLVSEQVAPFIEKVQAVK
jgi:HEAT repeat protein